jgi:hypothetical protein
MFRDKHKLSINLWNMFAKKNTHKYKKRMSNQDIRFPIE